MSLSKYISAKDSFQKRWNTTEHNFLISDIINFKSSEKFPFRFSTFPEFKQKVIDYMQHTPTRTFSSKMAKKMVCNAKKDSEIVPLSWDTIYNIFLEGTEEGDKIVLPNNSHLKDLMEKSGTCMYSNQHTKSNCPFFSCPPFQLDTDREDAEDAEWIRKCIHKLKNPDEKEEIDYKNMDDEENGENGEIDEDDEGREIDYNDEEEEEETEFDKLW